MEISIDSNFSPFPPRFYLIISNSPSVENTKQVTFSHSQTQEYTPLKKR